MGSCYIKFGLCFAFQQVWLAVEAASAYFTELWTPDAFWKLGVVKNFSFLSIHCHLRWILSNAIYNTKCILCGTNHNSNAKLGKWFIKLFHWSLPCRLGFTISICGEYYTPLDKQQQTIHNMLTMLVTYTVNLQPQSPCWVSQFRGSRINTPWNVIYIRRSTMWSSLMQI